MAATTSIEWTDRTWNPVVGCSLVSPGCTNCYAMRMAGRIEAMGTAPHYAGLTKPSKAGPVWTGEVRAAPEHVLLQPLRWRRPSRIFVNSMSDLFHEDLPDAVIDRVFAIMAMTPHHTYQVLTKRPERMRAYVSGFECDGARRLNVAYAAGWIMEDGDGAADSVANSAWPLPNVWLGVSVEDQSRADERIPILLDTPAAVRWISAEPLLGPVDLTWMEPEALRPSYRLPRPKHGLDWVVAGGESGPDARPMHPDWTRSLRDQCAAAGVPFLFKQWGEWWPVRMTVTTGEPVTSDLYDGPIFGNGEVGVRLGKRAAGRLLDGVLHDAYPGPRL
jgi:protein gp37